MPKAMIDPGQLQEILDAIADVTVTVNAADIEIGAVELKDGATDTRVKVKSDGVDNALVVIQNKQVSSANTPAIVTSAGTALSANAARKQWRIQNLGTNPLFVRLGASASSTVFHVLLKGGLSNDDGLGGIVEDDTYTGIVSVAGTSPRFVVTEL